MIYTDNDAEMNKERVGQKYKPSNGTEGYMFLDAQCGNCVHKSDCTIPSVTMAFSVDDDEYPKEWVYGDDGNPRCTAFNSNEKKLSGSRLSHGLAHDIVDWAKRHGVSISAVGELEDILKNHFR